MSDIDREAPTPRVTHSWQLWSEVARDVARDLYTAGDEALHREALELGAFAETWPKSPPTHDARWAAQSRILELRQLARTLIGEQSR